MGDGELIDRACAGDGAAMKALHDRYAPRVMAVVRRIAGDADLAEDCAQEAWVRAFRALPEFRREARFSTWLHRIAVNAALQAVRSWGRREGRETDLPDHLPDPSSHRDVLLEDRLQACMDRLPDGMRKVLVLHDVEGFSHQEIGELLGVSEGTSKSQLFKARARMRRLLRPSVESANQEGAQA